MILSSCNNNYNPKYNKLALGRELEKSMKDDMMYQDEEEEEGEPRKPLNLTSTFNKLYNNWPSSRIIRVSRASGGKDRHSKVLTSRGLRDRRVRLSVGTAIQFYDLQDRLGYDQPSKAVEWLLRAAASSIDELPPIYSPFFPDDKSSSRRSDKADVDNMDAVNNNSTTEDSVKGSELSLSRSESRVRRRASRERANKERELLAETTKVDDNEEGSCNNNEYFQLNPNYYVSRTSSFTELLNGRMNNDDIIAGNHSHNKQWEDPYFTNGLMDPNCVCAAKFTSSSMEMQHLSSSNFALDLMDPVGNYNENNSLINFAISSSSSSGAHSSSLGLTGFNRGTLQSNNSQSFMPQSPHRFNPPQDGLFFLGSSMAQVENNNHGEFDLSGFDARLQLSYGDDASNGSHKVEGKK